MIKCPRCGAGFSPGCAIATSAGLACPTCGVIVGMIQ